MLQRYRAVDSGRWKSQGRLVLNGSSKPQEVICEVCASVMAASSVLSILRPEKNLKMGFI
jgi:hypothetical protein